MEFKGKFSYKFNEFIKNTETFTKKNPAKGFSFLDFMFTFAIYQEFACLSFSSTKGSEFCNIEVSYVLTLPKHPSETCESQI